ncbi:MAG: c-type cytochrome [Candidatus Lindowbacteria bacterium]|nr:c-type cytochrome [Candidatus Lindowbacteria bacterium]
MSDIGHLYDRDAVNKVFAACSILLLVCTGWMIVDDATREWKDWQVEFNKMEVSVTRSQLDDAEGIALRGGWEKALTEMNEANDTRTLAASQRAVLEDQLIADQAVYARLEAQITVMSGEIDAMRSQEELYSSNHHADPDLAEVRLAASQIAELDSALQKQTRKIKALKNEIKEMDAKYKLAETKFSKLTGQADLLEKKLQRISPSFLNEFRNAPLLDFLDPSLRIKQLLPDDLYVVNSFAKAPQVDRCISCHLSIDKTLYKIDPVTGNFEDPNVAKYISAVTGGQKVKVNQFKKLFGAHPQLDLFVGEKSPHPASKFGCVTCHVGNGLATSFNRAAHTPSTRKQVKLWGELYGWKEPHYEEFPMRPLWETDASCRKCHVNQLNVKKAPTLNRGMKIVRRSGCFACHNMEVFNKEALFNPGPSLLNIKDKLKPEWVEKWVQNPHELRPATAMPRIFGVAEATEGDEEEVSKREAVEIKGIVTYLFNRSGEAKKIGPVGSGSKTRGKKLFDERGCQAWHMIGTPEKPVSRAELNPAANNAFGPPLDGIGAKTSKAWLVAWIKDPKSLRPETKMPDLRLSNQEALDIAEFLMDFKTPNPKEITLPVFGDEDVQAVSLKLFQEKKTYIDAANANDALSNAERLDYIGKRAIFKQGCFSCHTISGFKEESYVDANRNNKYDNDEEFTDENGDKRWNSKPLPIGADLSDWGRKNIHQIDFGLLHDLNHSRGAWLARKLANPRAFDKGRIVEYKNRLRMPRFDFRPQDIPYIVTAILSFTREEMAVSRIRRLDHNEQDAEIGMRIVRARNCQGCHVIDGEGGEAMKDALAKNFSHENMDPPSLEPEGARVRSRWLFPFLKKPNSTIRPWLVTRMPTFGFNDEQANQLIRMFAGQSGIDEILITESEIEKPTAAMVSAGSRLFTKANCLLCHATSAPVSTRAPDLAKAKGRLREAWIADWIGDPPAMIPNTRMPPLFPINPETGKHEPLIKGMLDNDGWKQVEATRDYVLSLGR